VTCERDGQVLETQSLIIDRGERKALTFGACAKALQAGPAAAAAASSSAAASRPNRAAPACRAGGGFRSASARGAGRRVALAFQRRVRRPVTVDVFQQSAGRRVLGERLIARFTNRSRGFTWNGRANRRGRRVTDGYYVVRYRTAGADGTEDVRRVALRRSRGRWTTRPAYYRPDSCGLVRSFKLTRPVFGGRNNQEVIASFRLARSARASLEVLRGSRVIRRLATQERRGGLTHRLRVDSERLAIGDLRFRLTVRDGSRTRTTTLTARRI
jgi:hypothetical protein